MSLYIKLPKRKAAAYMDDSGDYVHKARAWDALVTDSKNKSVEIARLRKALEWYGGVICQAFGPDPFFRSVAQDSLAKDAGKRAREALGDD